MGQKLRISHITSVHPRYDTRIFFKQCRSLSAAGYDVSFVVADGKGDEIKEGIQIYDVGKSYGRLNRFFHTTHDVFTKAKALNSDIYHFHDPELMPFALKLKKLGKKVIFDSHEDVPKQTLSKLYLNKPIKLALAYLIMLYERFSSPQFDAIITATRSIQRKFIQFNYQTVCINNFPILGELNSDNEINWNNKNKAVCYIGSIGVFRGIKEMVLALEYTKSGTLFELAGEFSEDGIDVEVKSYKGWDSVSYLGHIDRLQLRHILSHCMAGLVIFHPIPNHIDAQPNKMFEYMSAGLPVIASDFPLWKEIIEGNRCGICVDPLDPKAIAEAITFIVENPAEAEQMGKNGHQAVLEKYNWNIEEKKLLALYEVLMKLRG